MAHAVRRVAPLLLAAGLAPMLSGCLAKTALDVVSAPVKVASKGADLATTSQSEADEKRGRAMRQREEQLGQLERQYWRLDTDCRDGDERACLQQEQVRAQIDRLRHSYPAY